MYILNAADVAACLPMHETIEAMKSAYSALSTGRAVVPLRTHLPIETRQAGALFMPAFVPGDEKDSLAVKIVTLFPGNPEKGLPFIHAAVLVMDAENGSILAMIEGGTLTAIRTGAGAGAATDLLARANSRVAAIFGTGPQARTQLEAVCAVRPIEEARIFSRNPQNIEAFIAAVQPRVAAKLHAAGSPTEALRNADIVCAATNANIPVFRDDDITAGMHINGVGSYTPDMVEIPPETLARSLIAVDSKTACAAEAGEIIHAVRKELILQDQIHEIGSIIAGRQPGRTSMEQITYFKSVGVAVQDAAAAQLALQNARSLGLGTEVHW